MTRVRIRTKALAAVSMFGGFTALAAWL